MPIQPGASTKKRREGFAGQRIVVLPTAIIRAALRMPLLRGLLPVATGFFPKAEWHLVERERPLPEGIVIVCISGFGWLRLRGLEQRAIGPGTALFVPPGEPHAYGADEANPWSIFWAHFRGDDVSEYLRLLEIDREHPTLPLLPDVAGQLDFDQLYERLNEDYTTGNLLAAAACLRAVLSDINRWRTRSGSQTTTDVVERTIASMRKHIQRAANLAELAREARMSNSHYSALFRRKTGYSPVDYFLRMKVRRACGLLDTTTMRIEEVASEVGYDDPFYFSRLFRRVMGESPRAYRATKKG